MNSACCAKKVEELKECTTFIYEENEQKVIETLRFILRIPDRPDDIETQMDKPAVAG